MIRIVIDIDGDDTLATKEAVAMCLEPMGKVRIVSVDDGRGRNEYKRMSQLWEKKA